MQIDGSRIVSGAEALENMKSNRHVRWGPQFEKQDLPFQEDWAVARMETEPFNTHIRPSFQVKRGDMVFASGSCFAQNIEMNLMQSGMRLLYGPEFFAAEQAFETVPEAHRRTALTMYNTPNIMRFIKNLHDDSVGDTLIYGQGTDKFVDYTMGALAPVSKDVVLARRTAMKAKLQADLSNCSCVIFTLGLSEVWFDRECEDYLNYTPDLRLLKRNPDRFEVHVLDYQTTVGYLRAGISELRAHGVENIVITVSPVPLISTFTSDDVIVANEYSKSVLRVAAEHVCNELGCDYFPSYELVRYANLSTAWNRDRRHPTSEIIGKITRLFAQNYIEGL